MKLISWGFIGCGDTKVSISSRFAQDSNEKYKTLDDLKADIKRNMETAVSRRIDEGRWKGLR